MTTTMHFGPEWMRTKQQTLSRPQPPPSPPPHTSNSQSNASTYSALVSPMPPAETEKHDETHPFRYSKEEMLRIFKEGGGKGGLGLEVERWEGVVRENGSEPVGLREMSEGEKKLFAGPLNSELRRRQSTDYLSLNTSSYGGDRSRLNYNNANPGSPMRERFSSFMGKKRDSTDPPALSIPRKQSLSSSQGPLGSPRDTALPSPRTRMGGFDGVLSSGDSWMARRKAAEGLSKPPSAPRGDVGGEGENKVVHIKEEPNTPAIVSSEGASAPSSTSQKYDPSLENQEPGDDSHTQAVSQAMDDLSLCNDGHLDPVLSSGNPTPAAMLPGPSGPQLVQDIANIEWSYLDPRGNVQGPFVASIMQKWHDDGYFTPDLLMKRTNTDTEWIPVGELARRANGAKIFLSPLIPTNPPPGLSRRTNSPMQSFAAPSEITYNIPFQPVPQRTLRTSTLDSYLGSPSNPSDSPSSSFGAGRFSNGSPDPSAFGGRVGGSFFAGDPLIGTRMTGFPTGPSPAFAQNRGVLNEPFDSSLGMRNTAFGNVAPGRASSVDNYGFNIGYNSNQQPWPANGLNSAGSTFESANAGHPVNSVMPYNTNYESSRNILNGIPDSQFGQSGAFGNHAPQDGGFVDNPVGFTAGEYNATGISGNPAQNSNAGFGNFANGENHSAFTEQNQQFTQSPTLQFAVPLSSQATIIEHPQVTNAPQQSPWNNVEAVPMRHPGPGPFDASHPKASNTVANNTVASTQSSPWGLTGQTSKSTSVNNNASPWYTASQDGAIDDRWRETPGPNSLTFDNVGVHNQQQEAPENDVTPPGAEVTIESQPPSPAVPPAQPSTESTLRDSSPPPPATAPLSKSKRRTMSQQNQRSLATTKTTPVPIVSDSSPTTAAVKPAWATEDDSKKPKSSAGLGLREIQEAEVKKLEARKAAERERAVRAVASASPVNEDTQTFTASWGLPTSRTGGRNDSLPKESIVTNTASPQTSGAPVWTNTGMVPQTKKSMKEIQEEEEKRRKLGVRETVASAAARRGYAETTNKVTPMPQSAGSAWTTVGATGKATVTAATPNRPTVLSFSAAGPSAQRTNGPSTSRPTMAPKPSATPKVEDFPAAPSHEFLKWLNDSLKGLNPSVNVEDIVSMLLLFPLDPDPSAVELISDTIYSNSTTLDGRRFASEYVSKRKADVVSRRGATISGKPVSIADVVRMQPKPTQPEWGGFKVVNKKKRGGRS